MRPRIVVGHRITISTPGVTDTNITDLTDEGHSGGTLLKVTIKLSAYTGLGGTYWSLFVGDPADDDAIIRTKYFGSVPESVEVGRFLRATAQDLTLRIDHQGTASSFKALADFSYYVAS